VKLAVVRMDGQGLQTLACYSGPFCQDKKSTGVKIQNPPVLLARNLEGQVHFLPL